MYNIKATLYSKKIVLNFLNLLHLLKVFNSKTAELLSHHQVEIRQSFPREG